MADKIAAMQRLADFRLRIPSSLIVTRSGLVALSSFLESHQDVRSWYLRFDELLAPSLPRVLTSEEILRLVPTAIEASPKLSVIVQERIVACVSGAIIVRPDFIFVEYVNGEPLAILRAGVTPSRVLLLQNGEVVCSERNRQEFCCLWEQGQLTRNLDPSLPSALSENTLGEILVAARQVETFGVLEWIQMDDGTVVFLDHRPMPPQFLAELRVVESSFKSHCYQTLANPSGAILKPEAKVDGSGVFFLDRPLYEYAETVLPNATKLVFAAGAVLAHACVYAGERGIPCVVSAPAA